MEASPLVTAGPVTLRTWISQQFAAFFSAADAAQLSLSDPDSILDAVRPLWDRLERDLLDAADRKTPLIEFRNVDNYYNPTDALNVLYDFMTKRGYFTNYVGCVQYMVSTANSVPKLNRMRNGKNVTQKCSRLAVMAYHSRSDITDMCRNKGEASHLCNNYLCFNPNHLTVETHEGNVSRKSCPTTYRLVVYPIDGEMHYTYIGEDLCQHTPKCIRVEYKYDIIREWNVNDPDAPDATDASEASDV